jgi:selenocysteine lyase/cysteine desulfurase
VAQAWGENFHAGLIIHRSRHHSNLVPWQLLWNELARDRFVPVREDGTLVLDQLPQLLTPR